MQARQGIIFSKNKWTPDVLGRPVMALAAKPTLGGSASQPFGILRPAGLNLNNGRIFNQVEHNWTSKIKERTECKWNRVYPAVKLFELSGECILFHNITRGFFCTYLAQAFLESLGQRQVRIRKCILRYWAEPEVWGPRIS